MNRAALVATVFLVGSLTNSCFKEDKNTTTLDHQLYKKLAIEKPEKLTSAADFTLENLSRKRVSLESLRGNVVFLNFWATWCPPCVQEMPSMEKLHREFKDKGLKVIAINYRETPAEVNRFFTKHKLTFTALMDYEGTVSERYQVWGLPATVLIDQQGQIIGKVSGARDWHSDPAIEFFQELLRTNSSGAQR